MAELDWLELAFDGRALAHLVSQCGWFSKGAKRRKFLALIYLLTDAAPDGETILSYLVAYPKKRRAIA